jgi:hypothetical protein
MVILIGLIEALLVGEGAHNTESESWAQGFDLKEYASRR